MANTVIILCLCILSSTLLLPRVTMAKQGLTIKLIQRDSPKSPLYQPNLTQEQRIQKLILLTKARAKYSGKDFQAKHNDSNINVVRPIVDHQMGSYFLAKMSIGTFRSSSPISYFLHMDTGSHYTWIQCQGCKDQGNHCFYQRQPVFNSSQSSTYRRLPSGHPLCPPGTRVGNLCSYRIQYADGAHTEGDFASDTFTFDSSSRFRKEKIPNMVFGCGNNQAGFDNYAEQGGNVDGILALGWSPQSLVNQLGSRAQGRFSYCLHVIANNNHSRTTYLRFCADIPTSPYFRNTEIYQYPRLSVYFVNMTDISVAGTPLGIPSQHFARTRTGIRGTIIDTGSPYSWIVQPAYEILERALVNRFSRIPGLKRITLTPKNFDLCYQRPAGRRQGYNNLPTITFHFLGTDLVVQPWSAFVVGIDQSQKEYFCLAMVSTGDATSETVIGAYQQRNHRFIFDLNRKSLCFGPQDCVRNP